jgi:hypothetical protein
MNASGELSVLPHTWKVRGVHSNALQHVLNMGNKSQLLFASAEGRDSCDVQALMEER